MEKKIFLFFAFLISLKGQSQCSNYYNQVMDILKKQACYNISIQQNELSDLFYKMSLNCPEEVSKFNKWKSSMKTDQDIKNYFCIGNTIQKSNFIHLRDDKTHYDQISVNEYVKKGAFYKCFHTQVFSMSVVNSGKPFTCERCNQSITKEILEASLKEYKAIPRYSGDEAVDGNGNIVNSSSSPTATSYCPSTTQASPPPTPQSNPVISQYKDKPIEYSKNNLKETSIFSSLKEEEKKKLLENLESRNIVSDFDESKINEILDIKEDRVTKPIFDTYYYTSFSDAIYKTTEESQSAEILEDVSGYSFDVTFTVNKDGFIENIRFQNEKGIGSTPKINQSLKAIIFYLSGKRLWKPATKNNVSINDDVTIEIDVDKYLKAFYFLKNLNRDLSIIEEKEKMKNEIKLESKKSNSEMKDDRSYYQKFIDFKNKLINETTIETKNSDENGKDYVVEVTENMENEAKKDLLKLLMNPKATMSDIRNYISTRLKSLKGGLKEIWEGKLTEIDEIISDSKD